MIVGVPANRVGVSPALRFGGADHPSNNTQFANPNPVMKRRLENMAPPYVNLRMRDLFDEHRKLLVDVAAAGQERAQVAIDVGERAEPVVFQLEQPIVMVERIRDPYQRHRTPHEGHRISLTPRPR
jgi:hypothetical protein